MSNHHAVVKTQAELAELFAQDLTSGVGRSVKHDSAAKHVSGEAQYIDDRLEFPNQLHLYARMSDRAHARILSIDTAPCYAFEGVRIVITHEDVPGLKDIGPLMPGDPLLAIDTVQFVGQVVLAVAARDLETARKAAMAAVIEYEDLEPVLDVVEAFRKKHFVLDSHTHQRGDSAGALATAKNRIQGTLHIGGQEHFYLETQISSVMPTEDGGMIVYCSTQNPIKVHRLCTLCAVSSVTWAPRRGRIAIRWRRSRISKASRTEPRLTLSASVTFCSWIRSPGLRSPRMMRSARW